MAVVAAESKAGAGGGGGSGGRDGERKPTRRKRFNGLLADRFQHPFDLVGVSGWTVGWTVGWTRR